LVYLIYVAGSVRQNSHGAAAVAGYAVLAAFAACWLAVPLVPAAEASKRRFWAWYAVLAALAVAGLPFPRAPGFVLCRFLPVSTVARPGARAPPIVARPAPRAPP